MKVSAKDLANLLSRLPDPKDPHGDTCVIHIGEPISIHDIEVRTTSQHKQIILTKERLLMRDAKGNIHDYSYWTLDI